MSLSLEDFRQFLTELGVDSEEVQPDTPLFSSGLIDSFSLVVLMTFIEKSGGVSISPADVTLENFDSVERILEFIERRKSEAS